MGMAASQVRMLSLTARLSDLEYSAQSISNSKISLSTKSEDASKKYLAALDKEILTVKNPDTSSYVDATAKNLTTYAAISTLDKQRFLKTTSGQVIVSSDVAEAYKTSKSKKNSMTFTSTYTNAVLSSAVTAAGSSISAAASAAGSSAAALASAAGISSSEIANAAGSAASAAAGRVVAQVRATALTALNNESATELQNNFDTVDDYLDASLGYSTVDEYLALYPEATTAEKTTAQNQITYSSSIYDGTEGFLENMGLTSNPSDEDYDASAASYYENVFKEMEECGYQVVDDSNLNDSDWLYEQLTNGTIYLSEWDADGGKDGEGDFVNISWSSGDSTLVTESDEVGLAKAEAEYNVTTADIQTKDKRYDMQLKSIDTEHSAIQTEIDSVKKVIDKNIERTFKIFDA